MTKVIIMADVSQADRQLHIHIAGRDKNGRFLSLEPAKIIGGGSVGYAEIFVHDGAQVLLSEHGPDADERAVEIARFTHFPTDV